MKKRTRVAHLQEAPLPAGNRPLVAPIHQSVKFEFEDVAATEAFLGGQRPGFYYSRMSNPTLRQLEIALAELQEREACVLTGSGVAAISMTLVALLASGDHVVHFAESYQPTFATIRRLLGRFGVTSTLLSIDDLDGLERTLVAKPTRVVVFESLTNPALKVADVARITALAKAHGALTICDNTLGGLHNFGASDVDVFVHSLTKYASGHGDVMGGAILGPATVVKRIRDESGLLGPALDPHAAFLILRGLKTYFARWDQQCANALQVARFLVAHPAVARVRYPGLQGDPGHARAAEWMDGFGAVVTADLVGDAETGRRLADALELFSVAASLGSTESLVLPPQLLQPRGLAAAERAWADVGAATVRFSIGLEDPDDLVNDLGRALAIAASIERHEP